MAFRSLGPVKFSGGMDDEGHREYKVKYLVVCDTNTEAVAGAMQTPGLPLIGQRYVYTNEIDLWAWRRPGMEVEEVPGHQQGDFPYHWFLTFNYSTKPRRSDQERPHAPNNNQVQDPLLEPQKVSGGFNKYTEEGTFDRFGDPIVNSSWEQIRGASNEWDNSRASITIEQNVAQLQLSLFGPMVDTVNDRPLWGCPKRSIKLSTAPWIKHWEKDNRVYYTRTFTFEVNLKLDTKAPNGQSGLNLITGSNSICGGNFSTGDVGRLLYGVGFPVGGTLITGFNPTSGCITVADASTVTTASGSATVVPSPGALVSGWDRDILDEGTKALRGHWSSAKPPKWILDGTPNPLNPLDYVRAVDSSHNVCKVILNGQGVPYDIDRDGYPGNVHVEKYPESNFLLLNIPITF